MRIVGGPAGLAILLLSVAVSYSYGELGIIRLVGAGFLVFSVWGSWAPRVELYLGQYSVGSLTGWHKAWALVPAAAIGGALLYYAPELALYD